jgi:hypothetical protein
LIDVSIMFCICFLNGKRTKAQEISVSRRDKGKNDRSSLRRNTRLGVLAAAVTEIVFLSPAQASDSVGNTDAWVLLPVQSLMITASIGAQDAVEAQAQPATGNLDTAKNRIQGVLPADGSVKADPAAKPSPVGQPATDYHPKPSATSIDHIVVPSPEIDKAQAVMAADAHTIGPISQALHSYQLTPSQLISVRNYIGQYDDKTKVVSAGSHGGISVFQIDDAASGKYVGQVEVSAGSNGEVVVSKVTAAEFDSKGTVQIPVAGKIDNEEAQKLLGGSAAYKALTTQEKSTSLEMVVPTLVNVEGHAEYGGAREATAHFYPDGSGYEYGLAGQVASAQAELKAQVSGVAVGAGASGPGVKGFVNYFSKAEADEHGKFSRSVMGGTMEVNMTLAEIEAKYGCVANEPCGVETKAGALGVGGGVSLTFSQHEDIPVVPANKIEDTGIAAAAPVETPSVPQAEQQAYDQAAASGDNAKLEAFLKEYPYSAMANDVNNLIDYHAADHPDEPMLVVGY